MDILDTSAGWKRTSPRANQDREPFTSTPRKMTEEQAHHYLEKKAMDEGLTKRDVAVGIITNIIMKNIVIVVMNIIMNTVNVAMIINMNIMKNTNTIMDIRNCKWLV